MNKTNEELQNDIDYLVFTLGAMVGTVILHKLDIEDEAYEELMNELNTISNNAIGKL